VGRPRALAGLVAAASVSLLASALWGPPVAVAVDQPSDQTAAATESPAPEPSATPSPDLSPTPSPAPSPSLPPSPGDSGSTTPDSSPAESHADPFASPTISPTEPPNPSASPSASRTTQADDGSVDNYIVVVRNAAYIDSIKEKAQSIGGQTDKELRGAVDGFTAELTEQDVDELEADPNVRYIEAGSHLSVEPRSHSVPGQGGPA